MELSTTYISKTITTHLRLLAEQPANLMDRYIVFMYRRPTLYPLEIAVDFLKSL